MLWYGTREKFTARKKTLYIYASGLHSRNPPFIIVLNPFRTMTCIQSRSLEGQGKREDPTNIEVPTHH